MEKQICIKKRGTAVLLALMFALSFLFTMGLAPAAAQAAGEDWAGLEETDAVEAGAAGAEAQPAAELQAIKGVVVVDAGHGVSKNGVDGGASAPDGSINEAKLNPKIAGKLATLLKSRGYTVYTTYKYVDGVPHLTEATRLDVSERAAAANTVKPDVFISIHHNSSGSKAFDGACGSEVLYPSEQIAENKRAQSADLAGMVSSSVRALGYTKGNRASGVKAANPDVLKYSTAAAVTLEVGFLTNQQDLAMALQDSKQNEITAKAADAIDKYFAKYPSTAPDPTDKTGPVMHSVIFSQSSPTYVPDFHIKARNVKDKSGVKSVSFQVWRSGDSSSKRTLNGKHDGKNNWSAVFKLSQFAGKAGTYKVTAFGTDGAGNKSNMGSAQIVVRADTAKPTVEKLVFGEKSPTFATSFALQAQNVKDASGVKAVKFKVWPTGGAAKTYNGVDKGNGNWDTLFKLSDFGNKAATYNVRVYTYDKRGNSGLAISGKIAVQKDTAPPTMRQVIFGVKSPTDQPTFAVQAQGVQDNDQVKAVKFRVWNTTIANPVAKTYAGVDKGNGNWDALVNLRDFKYANGTYKVNVYGYDRADNSKIMGSKTIVVDGDFDTKPPTMNRLLFGETNPTIANTFAVQAQGVQDESGVEKVRFRVYRKVDGEKSYKAYDGVKKGVNWEMTFKLSDFKNKTGTYVVQAYGYDKMGNSGFMGSSSIKITGDTSPPHMEALVFAVQSPTSIPEFAIQAKGVTDPAGVESIRFRVWNKENSKTVKNYVGVKSGSNWHMTFKLSDFGNESGKYMVTVYGTDKKGNTGVIGGGDITVNRVVGNVMIMGNGEATVNQMVNFFKSSGYSYPAYYEQAPRSTSLQQFAQYYADVCKKEGVRADIAWVQMCLETKFLNFGGDVTQEQFNFAGIGATGGGAKGFDFAARYGNNARGIKYGVIAQVQHLKAYASSSPAAYLNADGTPIDPRWSLVSRGCAPTVEALSGKWATGPQYGEKIIAYLNRLLNSATTASLASIELEEEAAVEAVIQEQEQPVKEQPAYAILEEGQPNVTKEQLMNYYIANAQAIPGGGELDAATAFPLFYGIALDEFAAMYIEEAAAEGVNVEVAFAQAMKDTNFLRFGGTLAMADYVFAAYEAPQPISYADVRTGIRAQVQHLKLLAGGTLQGARVDALWDDALAGSVTDAALLGGEQYGAQLLALLQALVQTPGGEVAYIPVQPPEAEAEIPEAVEEQPQQAEEPAPAEEIQQPEAQAFSQETEPQQSANDPAVEVEVA